MIASPLTVARSMVFNLTFFGWSLLASVLFLPLFLSSVRNAQRSGPLWSAGALRLAQLICGLRHELRGLEFKPDQPCIFAVKHQSAWDTIIFLRLFPNPAYVLKRELCYLPGWGWYLWRMRMIAINRSAGASGLKDLIKQSKQALKDGRPIIIFPEGTRTEPGADTVYHPGIIAMYNQLKVQVVPVALNSGLYWGRNAFTKHPGKIIMQFLPPIQPGLEKEEFMKQLKNSIETATQNLVEEGKH